MQPDREVISFAMLDEVKVDETFLREHSQRAHFSFVFAVDGVGIAVRFTERRARDFFAKRYADMRSDLEPAHQYFVTSFDGLTHFWSDAADVRELRWPLEADVIAFLADSGLAWFVARVTHSICLHAAVLAGSKKMLALGGRTTAGKTTTAIACMRRGMQFYTDERCLLRDGGVPPYLRAISLRPGGRRALESDGFVGATPYLERILNEQQHDAELDIPLRPSDLSSALAGGPRRRLDAVFFITGRDQDPRVEQLNRYRALSDLLEVTITEESELDRVARILRDTRHLAFFSLVLGKPDDTAKLLADFANS